MTVYLTLIEALAIHEDQIQRYGGANGIRDQNLLQAALFRPQSGYYSDTIEEAAALWESLTQNHPFIDGNKRTGFAITFTFLAINGIKLTASADETYTFISGALETGNFKFEQLASWLRAHTVEA